MDDNSRCTTSYDIRNRFVTAFLIFCICGISGVLLDLDHVLALWYRGLPITWENLVFNAGRPLHIPAMLVSGLVCVILCALLVRQVVVR